MCALAESKPKIIIHIGAGKTGSSAIQSVMRQYRTYFEKNKLFIPDRALGNGPNVTGEHVFAFQQLHTAGDQAALKAAIEKMAAGAPAGHTILLSAENLSNPGVGASFTGLLDGFDAKVIFYVRRQDDYLASAWQQWNSKIETDINAWLIGALRDRGHWYSSALAWERAVGSGNVIIRPFQRSDLKAGDVVRDFLDILGIDDPERDFDVGTVNPSYNDIITPLVAGATNIFSNVHDNRFYAMVSDLTGEAYTKSRRVSLLSREQREKILFFYDEENKQLCKRFLPNRARLFEPIEHAKYDYLSPDALKAQQMRFLAHLIFELYQNTRT